MTEGDDGSDDALLVAVAVSCDWELGGAADFALSRCCCDCDTLQSAKDGVIDRLRPKPVARTERRDVDEAEAAEDEDASQPTAGVMEADGRETAGGLMEEAVVEAEGEVEAGCVNKNAAGCCSPTLLGLLVALLDADGSSSSASMWSLSGGLCHTSIAQQQRSEVSYTTVAHQTARDERQTQQ